MSVCVCVSGFGVGQSASSRVCCSFVGCGSGCDLRVRGSILAGAGNLSFLFVSAILRDLYCLPFRHCILIIIISKIRF